MVLDVEKLIRLVQERRSLWCQASPNYKNNKYKKLLWEDIGRKLNVSGLAAKHKWRNLRDTFARQCIALNQPFGKKFVRWKFYQHMAFLKKELQTRSSMQKLPSTEETFEVTYLDTETVLIPTPPPALAEDPTLEEHDVLLPSENCAKHCCTSSDNGMEVKRELNRKQTGLGREEATRSGESNKTSSNYYFLNSLVDPLDALPLEVQLHIKEQYTYLLHTAIRKHHHIPSNPTNIA